jgi:hypothetical protein
VAVIWRYERGWPSYYNIVRRGKNVDVRGVQNSFKSWRQTPAIAGAAFLQLMNIVVMRDEGSK